MSMETVDLDTKLTQLQIEIGKTNNVLRDSGE